jgi:formate-dependent phosphoribosylglycinamide formyltransferase (GAR transformylase)
MEPENKKEVIIEEVVSHKTKVHRLAVKQWKANNRDKHLEHRRREYIYKKIKFEFLNILL